MILSNFSIINKLQTQIVRQDKSDIKLEVLSVKITQ